MKDIQKMREWLLSVGANPKLLDDKGYYGGSLYLANNQLTSIEFPEGMAIGGYLYLANNQLTSIEFPEGMAIGGSLDLANNQLTSIEFPEGMAIGGPLDLANNQLTSIEFPEGMAIGGYLDLANNQLTSIEFPEGMAIGGSLDLANNQLTREVTPPLLKAAPTVFHWHWRDRHFIKADGIFQQVAEKRGNVYRVKNIASDKVTYLVTDGDGRWAHGDTLKEAREDLIYKISDRDTSKYESLTLDSVLTKAEAIQCYRVITGACAAGTKDFVISLPEVKESYTIGEIITLTAEHYGHDTFKQFFTK